MNRFAHHSARRAAEVDAGFAHARYVVVPALLWAIALVAVAVASLLDVPEGAPAEALSPRDVPVVSLGA